MDSQNAANAKKTTLEAREDLDSSAGRDHGDWPTVEEFVDEVVRQCGNEDPSFVESVEDELNLPRGAIVMGAPERGLPPAREFVARLRKEIEG